MRACIITHVCKSNLSVYCLCLFGSFQQTKSSITDSVCHLYDAKITHYWSGSDDSTALVFDTCYTAYVTTPSRLIPVAASASENAGFEPGKAVDGLANDGQCFVSDPAELRSWWMADLGESKPVSELRVRTSQASIEARLGNSPDHTSNPLFGEPQQAVSKIVFKPNQLMSGRFLSLQSLDPNPGNVLTLCEVEIMEENNFHR